MRDAILDLPTSAGRGVLRFRVLQPRNKLCCVAERKVFGVESEPTAGLLVAVHSPPEVPEPQVEQRMESLRNDIVQEDSEHYLPQFAAKRSLVPTGNDAYQLLLDRTRAFASSASDPPPGSSANRYEIKAQMCPVPMVFPCD